MTDDRMKDIYFLTDPLAALSYPFNIATLISMLDYDGCLLWSDKLAQYRNLLTPLLWDGITPLVKGQVVQAKEGNRLLKVLNFNGEFVAGKVLPSGRLVTIPLTGIKSSTTAKKKRLQDHLLTEWKKQKGTCNTALFTDIPKDWIVSLIAEEYY